MLPRLKISVPDLVWVWLFHTSLILLLTALNPNHYTTTDSRYYLESAENISAGKGYTILENNSYKWNSTFPIGYPVTISIVSLLTQTSVLIASKLVNILASGVWLICLNRWFGKKKAVILGCILMLGPFLKLWAHTWSEPLFLIVLFSWTYHFYQSGRISHCSVSKTSYLFILGITLISIRYAGLFIIPLSLLYAFYKLLKKEKSTALYLTLLTFGWIVYLVGYFQWSKYQSQSYFGENRFEGNIVFTQNFFLFSKGILNEIFLLRDMDFQSPDILCYCALFIQIIILTALFKQLTSKKVFDKKPSSETLHFGITSLAYLIFLFIIRIFSQFDEPGYRLLAPFSFLLISGFMMYIPVQKFSRTVRYLLLLLVVFSWMDIAPSQNFKGKLLKSLPFPEFIFSF